MNWILFTGLGVLSYVGISLMGHLTGGAATSVIDAVLRLLRPYAFVAMLFGNLIWGVALYFGLKETPFAFPALIAVGVLTSFAYSIIFVGGEVTILKITGLVLVLAGIYLLA